LLPAYPIFYPCIAAVVYTECIHTGCGYYSRLVIRYPLPLSYSLGCLKSPGNLWILLFPLSPSIKCKRIQFLYYHVFPKLYFKYALHIIEIFFLFSFLFFSSLARVFRLAHSYHWIETPDLSSRVVHSIYIDIKYWEKRAWSSGWKASLPVLLNK
jgi:hypothetical protein